MVRKFNWEKVKEKKEIEQEDWEGGLDLCCLSVGGFSDP